MATIDPNIALGGRPLQLENPLAQYSQFAQIQNAQNQNALAQYQLSSAKREDDATNALNKAYKDAYDVNTGKIDVNKLRQSLSTGGFGAKLPGIEKTLAEMQEKKLQVDKLTGEITAQPVDLAAKQAKLVDDKMKISRGVLTNIDPLDPNAPTKLMAWHNGQHADPILGPVLKAYGITPEQSRAQIQDAAAKGPQAVADLITKSALGMEKFLELNKPTTTTVNQDGQTQMFQTPGLGGAPKSVGIYADVPLPPAVLAQKKEIARAGAPSDKQQNAFETGLGKGQSDRILANQVVAQDAAAILETNQIGRELLKSGAITGTGADFFVGFNNALKQAGIDFGYADAAANSQAYAAAMGANVGRIIKQFGAGTGLSDADRDYAAQMAGGKINLTEAALRKILDINDKAANRVIDLHNKNVKDVKTNIPLTVDKPTFTQPKSAVDQIPGQSRSAPAAAGNSVTLPDGRVKTFPNAAAANQFKKAAGL